MDTYPVVQHTPTPLDTRIPRIVRPVLNPDTVLNLVRSANARFNDSLSIVEPPHLSLGLVLPREMDRIKQLPPDERRRVVSALWALGFPSSPDTVPVKTAGVILYAPERGKERTKGYNVLLRTDWPLSTRRERQLVANALESPFSPQLPDSRYKPWIFLGKLFVSRDRRIEAEAYLSHRVPASMTLGQLATKGT